MGPKRLNAANDPRLDRDTRAQGTSPSSSHSSSSKLLIAFFVCARGAHLLSPPALLPLPLLQISVPPFFFFIDGLAAYVIQLNL